MKLVIFGGGSGKRFWPASRLNSPKQFQAVVGNKPLVRAAYERVMTALKPEDVFFSTGEKYIKEAKNLLPELPERNFIFEPEMRDTGPAVTLAVSYVHALYPDEIVAVIWSDHLIKNEQLFMRCLEKAETIAKKQDKICFVTIPARFPSVHRGYINFDGDVEPEDNGIAVKAFKMFVEKPNLQTAREYLEDGHYSWNPGYWVFPADKYLNKIKHSKPELYETCQKVVAENFSEASKAEFAKAEKISADYIFAEKVYPNEALVIYTDFGWSDVGEWISLKEALETSHEANVISGNVVDLGSKDTLVYNYEEGKLVATIGLEGYVVVNTNDVVAIFPKENNSKLKELLKGFEDNEKSKYL